MEDLIGDLTAVPQPIEVKLFSIRPLRSSASRKDRRGDHQDRGVVEVKSGVSWPATRSTFGSTPSRAGVEGVTPERCRRRLQCGHRHRDLAAAGHERSTCGCGCPRRCSRQQQMADLPIRATDGHIFPLSRVPR